MWRLYGGCELIRPKLLTVAGDADVYIGEVEFVTPGTYTFKVPLSVTRIHSCCIGAGAQGATGNYGDEWVGGGGGGLGWKNNIEVTPGEEITVVVGAVVGEGLATNGSSYIETSNGVVVSGNSPGQFNWRIGGDYLGDDGGNGGNGGNHTTWSGAVWSKGSGGGAGGYRGYGGNGATTSAVPGGQEGGSSGGASKVDSRGYMGNGARGGGTGLKGQGASGAPVRTSDWSTGDNLPAKVGNPGSGGSGAMFGAGGAGEKDGWDGQSSTQAGHGGVRIIWGNRFSYPDNADVIA